MFLSTVFAFWITDWTYCHGPYLHAILRIISRSVSGLATDSPCGVWGVDEPLASCMIVHFSAHISKWELVCKFGVIFHIFIISCLCSRFHVRNQWFFLLCNNLFIYQVLCTLIYRRRSLYSFLLVWTICIGTAARYDNTRAPFQYPLRRLIPRSRKVSNPRDLYLELSDRSQIWQAPRQHCCRCACQISKRCNNLNHQSRGFETPRDLTIRRLGGYWNGVQNTVMAVRYRISTWFITTCGAP